MCVATLKVLCPLSQNVAVDVNLPPPECTIQGSPLLQEFKVVEMPADPHFEKGQLIAKVGTTTDY